MWLTPLFYAVLTFRTLRQLFKSDTDDAYHPRRRSNSVTLDAALLQDMVWHTVIDMIDIVNMMFMDSAEQNEGASTQFLSYTYPDEALPANRPVCLLLCRYAGSKSPLAPSSSWASSFISRVTQLIDALGAPKRVRSCFTLKLKKIIYMVRCRWSPRPGHGT